MGRRTLRLTLDNLGDLPQATQACVFWELDPVRRQQARGHEIDEKRDWLSAVLREWGPCGRVLYVDDEYAGHIIWAPPGLLPGAAGFATAPVSADAVLVASAHVSPERRGEGLGRVLVQAMAKDVHKRAGQSAPGETALRAIEAFATERPRASDCVLPHDFWLSVGFATHRPHPVHPRMRMDLRSLVSWRGEFGSALERLWPQPMKSASSLRMTDLGRAPVISLTT